ncbi:MAG TPA: acyl carrier protein [Nitrospirae bacterium]|nr:acyl carrier protein [Nitrospirota bacterium]
MIIKEEVEKYVLELTNQPGLDPSMNLFENGLLTSLDFLDIISFIEETFNVSIEEDDIGMEYLGSINNIVNLVEKLKQNGK